jgi:hypothetical protein
VPCIYSVAAIRTLYIQAHLANNSRKVAAHQLSNAHIQRFRTRAPVLDEQIRQAVRALAEARSEILAARGEGASDDDEDDGGGGSRAPVGHAELLRYAKAIAKFTVPPSALLSRAGGAPAALAAAAAATLPTPPPEGADEALATTEGEQQQRASLAPGDAARVPAGGGGRGDEDGTRGVGWATLAEGQRAWLDQAARAPFAPWPAEETVRAGGLGAVQAMVEQGVDPRTAAAAVGEGAAATAAAEAGKEQGGEMEVDEREVVLPSPKAERRPAGPQPARPRAEAVVVDFGLYDPEADG